ncbi:hypothetical protein H310_01446 [Aphanomyces invadans]|uniref:Uncharacterized protein n=1 Tax=Aphanomyces invadans TaxID=157072 RepID=A0A024UTM0_9STRA|nr:hypothetical protein H310_01446 [Aphanomyces invadans]ETW08968.1 hypothetical protein H310_01446 [Aphanomyces invadans]|eukprot:XP_008862773.1 hypothetical protein H310_01446 [Aphanomyces invadans]
MAALVRAATDANVRQIQLEHQVVEGAYELVQLKSQLDQANDKLQQTEAQLAATLANALELNTTRTKLHDENTRLAAQLQKYTSDGNVDNASRDMPLRDAPQQIR